MIELTLEQRLAVAKQSCPIALDPDTKTAYVLMRKDVFDRITNLLAMDEYDPDEGAAHINEVMADDDANDPLLDTYQQRHETTP